MNDKKKSFRQKAENFLSGRGFYIALSACVLVIGVSAWTLLTSGTAADRTDVGESSTMSAGKTDTDSSQTTVKTPATDKLEEIRTKETEEKKDETAGTSDADEAAETMMQETQEEISSEEETEMLPLKFEWPVFGEVEVGYFHDELVYNKTMMDWRTHSAIDIAASLGAKVLACARGTVTEVYEDALLGTVVVIDHGDGVESLYANLAAEPLVSVGDEVTVSSVIGAVGDTAISESGQPYHLHFAMTRNGESVDPTEYLAK